MAIRIDDTFVVALAHMETPVTPENVWRSWNLDPFILLTLTVATALYVAGVRRVWAIAGRGNGVFFGQVAAFIGGMTALFAALVSPLDQLGGALFSAHMVQHLVLMLIAAPLLVWATPLVAMMIAMPRSVSSTVGWLGSSPLAQTMSTLLRNPLIVWPLQTIVLWMWHLPSLYEAALESRWVHGLEHLSFFVTAALFWWIVIQPHGRRTLGLGMAVIFIFTTMMQGSALGALITFAPTSWYDAHARFVAAWDLTPLEDQQLAGLIMWIPAGLIYLGAALAALAIWLRSMGTDEDAGRPDARVLDSGTGTDRSRSPRSG